MVKKVLAFTLTLFLLLSVLPAMAYAADDTPVLPIYGTPVIKTPEDGSVLPYGTVKITWDCFGSAAFYYVRLRESTASKALTYITRDKFFNLAPENLKPNVKYSLDIGAVYRNLYIDGTAEAGTMPAYFIRWSKPVVFAIQQAGPVYDAPVILTPADGSVLPYDTVSITWECEGQPQYYCVQITDSRLMRPTPLYTYITKDKFLKVPPDKLIPGVPYTLRVGAYYGAYFVDSVSVNGSSSILPPSRILWSTPVNFSLEKFEITAPVILTPKTGDVLPLGRNAAAAWTACVGAQYYIVTLRPVTMLTVILPPVFEIKTTGTRITVPGRILTEGTFSLTVTACFASGEQAMSNQAIFSVKGVTITNPVTDG